MPVPPRLVDFLRATYGVLSSRPARVVFLVLVLVIATRAIVVEWPHIKDALADLDPLAVLGALLALLAGMMAALAAWRTLMAGLGSPLPWQVAGKVLFVGQLGKYLPGSIWPMVAQMELGRDYGVPRRRSATVFVLLTALNLASALGTACLVLPFADGVDSRLAWLALLTPVFWSAFHPRVLNPLVDLMLKITRGEPLERPITLATSATALVALLVQWIFFGVHILVLGVDLGAPASDLAAGAIGGFAVAWALGPLLVIAPAGLGVREVTLVAVLAPPLTGPAALVVAIVSRLLMTVTDLLLALVFYVLGRVSARRTSVT